MYLAFSEDGKTRHIFVSKERDAEVRSWVEQYKQARELLEEISKVYLDKIQKREE